MVTKEYRDGAKALMDLQKEKKEGEMAGESSHMNDTYGDDAADKDNPGDNVEAAVMKYVAGTLGTTPEALVAQAVQTSHQPKSKRKRKKSFNTTTTTTTDANMDEFQHWNSFLIGAHDDSTKKKRKLNRSDSNIQVDPELASLDDAADHEQLVRAAIMDANQLTQDVNIQDYIDEDPHAILQATQAAAAAVMAAREAQESMKKSKKSKNRGTSSGSAKGSTSGAREQTADEAHTAALVADAVSKASNGVVNKIQGKMFSAEEISAIDKFINEYGRIHGMNHKQICERVWSNTRRKDDFWDMVHRVLPYRTRASVYKHVRRSYHVFEHRGKWTAEEDKLLARLAAEKDSQWKAIGEAMGRMPEDCRDRWRNYVKCGTKRASNKWTQEEEDKLRDIVTDMMAMTLHAHDGQSSSLNWTVVSEKMGGIRSRIQCRYKWNKMVKRSAILRASKMDINDRLWMLNKLQELNFDPNNDANWEGLAVLHGRNEWTATDFRTCYEKMKQSVKDHKKKSMMEVCHDLLRDLVVDDSDAESVPTNTDAELPVVFYRAPQDEKDDEQASPATEVSKSETVTKLEAQEQDIPQEDDATHGSGTTTGASDQTANDDHTAQTAETAETEDTDGKSLASKFTSFMWK